MQKNLVRYQQTGNLHFVTFSCYQRLPYLGTPGVRDLFERSLETMRLRYEFFISAYVIMPEHVHLLMSEPKVAQLSVALQALNSPSPCNSRCGLSGSIATSTKISLALKRSWQHEDTSIEIQ
jgi:REP element-mobilizing transposase RayT